MDKNYAVSYQTDEGSLVDLNFDVVRDVLAVGNNIKDSELFLFMNLCKYQKLNPFLKEAYLLKFGDKIQIVTGIDVFTNRLNEHPLCQGWESGLIIQDNENKKEDRAGTFYDKNSEKILGAWIRIYRKGWEKPFYWSISWSEYYKEAWDKDKKCYKPYGNWGSMPATMIVKCAISAGCRKAFPKNFTGLYSPEEMGNGEAIEGTFKVKEEPIKLDLVDDKDIKKIKDSAKSDIIKVDSEKLVEYTLKILYDNKKIPSINLEELPKIAVKEVIETIKKGIKVKEDKSIKGNDLPISPEKLAEPANTKKEEDKKDEK